MCFSTGVEVESVEVTSVDSTTTHEFSLLTPGCFHTVTACAQCQGDDDVDVIFGNCDTKKICTGLFDFKNFKIIKKAGGKLSF